MAEILDLLSVRVGDAPALPCITLGVEEELQVIGPDGGLVAHDIGRGQTEFPDVMGTSSFEIHKCVLEIQTPVCRTPDEIVRSLGVMRGVAAQRADAQGQRILSAALHPFSRWSDQELNAGSADNPRYARVLHDLGDIARSVMAFGMHVHLAPIRSDLRMPIMNRLRNVLPDIQALTANSPFFEGRDTGLDSWRNSLLCRLPRSGIPDIWESEDEYWTHVNRLRVVGCMDDSSGLWEDLRLHHRFGTLEVRIADAVHSLDRVWLVTALLQAEVATLEAELEQGCAPKPVPRALLEESKMLARRHGTSAVMVDWSVDRPMSFHQRLRKWVMRLEPAALRLGFRTRLLSEVDRVIFEDSPAEDQRRWLRETGSFSGLMDRLVAATAEPLSWTTITKSVEA